MWDYVGDGYVHRLIQSKTDGKLVELNAPCGEGTNECGIYGCSHDVSGMTEALMNSKLDGVCRMYAKNCVYSMNVLLENCVYVIVLISKSIKR